VQWRIVVKARKEGGLRLGSLMSKNISMLFKWIWRLSLPDHAL